MDTDIFFRNTESGYAWYVWTRSIAQAYFFTSADTARHFATLLASPHDRGQCMVSPHSLEEAATLI